MVTVVELESQGAQLVCQMVEQMVQGTQVLRMQFACLEYLEAG